MSRINARLERVEARIASACERSGRSRRNVRLIAVTKGRSIEEALEAYSAGIRTFGESRLQEAMPKIAALPTDVEWHFIGTLQSNKARRVAQSFECIHTLETRSQLEEIRKAGKVVNAFIEVNVSREDQKSGIECADTPDFLKLVEGYACIRFLGLMTIGPQVDDPESVRPYFRKLADANRAIGGTALSIGMSSDFEVAVEEGATHLRIGSALFDD